MYNILTINPMIIRLCNYYLHLFDHLLIYYSYCVFIFDSKGFLHTKVLNNNGDHKRNYKYFIIILNNVIILLQTLKTIQILSQM